MQIDMHKKPMTPKEINRVEGEIVEALKTIFDPEIPVNIYDLGLIYDIDYDPSGSANITMTLTAPNCPMADMLAESVKTKVAEVEDVKSVELNLTFNPPWTKDRLSDEAKLELGLL